MTTIDRALAALPGDREIGIYIHVPFCLRKCLYCDFCSFPLADPKLTDRYADRLCGQIRDVCSRTCGLRADTVFFGGGTPTLLSETQWDRILGTLRDSLDLSAGAEITAECNPATAGPEKLKRMRQLGVNRLSIGVQSLHPEELKTLGRIHTVEQFEQTVRDAGRAGFERISFDLMFGFPGQTERSWLQTLQTAVGLGPEHLSAYALQLEEGTPLYRNRDAYVFPDEEETARMYETACGYLQSEGYSRYEVSNFARPGGECRHNLKYWSCENYLGFGISAHSLAGHTRFYMPADLESYLDGSADPALEEDLTQDRLEEEYAVLRLRLSEGLEAETAKDRFGEHFDRRFRPVLRDMADRALLRKEVRDGREIYRIPDAFVFTENGILSELLSKVADAASFLE